jgi:hypothetical protein
MNNFETEVFEIIKDSQMKLVVRKNPLTGLANYVKILISGEAAKIPSVSNNRLNMFPKKGLFGLLQAIQSSNSFTNVKINASRAKEVLKKAQVVSTINPAFKVKLEALTRLWNSIPKKNDFPLLCDKEHRWLITVHCHADLNRIDTHNLTKGVCDWLQEVLIIKNDKDVDCWPMRNDDWARDTPENHQLTIAMRPLRDIGSEVSRLIATMTT